MRRYVCVRDNIKTDFDKVHCKSANATDFKGIQSCPELRTNPYG